MMQPNTMNEGDLVRFKKDRIGLAENGETIGIIINIITPDVSKPWIHVLFGDKMRLINSIDIEMINESR